MSEEQLKKSALYSIKEKNIIKLFGMDGKLSQKIFKNIVY